MEVGKPMGHTIDDVGLHQLTLDGCTIFEFLSTSQDLVDSLNAIVDPILVREHIAVIGEGLPETNGSSISFKNSSIARLPGFCGT
ncbi:hypothetical protein JHK82_042851 [Glycine max]|nr:hypothetical protein JHK86_042867 [Glycine max]KAG5105881.1 hypothetical protein JHK82_042851 [Glycine max]